MTTIGDILDEFFSPLSSEKMWVIPESDQYTARARKWKPVIEAVDRTKNDLSTNCSNWQNLYRSNPSWKPTMSDSPKPGAYRDFVASPPGTDPDTCKSAFIAYVSSKTAVRLLPPFNVLPLPIPSPIPLPAIQIDNLYTCSIGSFNVYTTVDSIDCATQTATMNFWMYNAMSKTSFGKFADDPKFKLCGMKTQYMWWNWVETVEWTTGTVKTVRAPVTTVPAP